MFKKNLNRSIAGNIILFLILFVFGLYTALPLLYVISNAFKPLDQLYIFPPPLIVRNPTGENFIQLGQICTNFHVPLSRYIFNSVLISVITTGGHVLITSLAAYPMSKHKFPGQKTLTKIIVVGMLFTAQVTYIPQYIIMSKIGLINTYGALICPLIISPLGLYLMQNFMVQMNDSMLEAARIDGAGEYNIYWNIVMPNCKPAWVTVIILMFVMVWNSNSNLYIYREELKVLPAILNSVAAGGGMIARAGVAAAAALVVVIPPALIFLLSENLIVETMSTSGLKE